MDCLNLSTVLLLRQHMNFEWTLQWPYLYHSIKRKRIDSIIVVAEVQVQVLVDQWFHTYFCCRSLLCVCPIYESSMIIMWEKILNNLDVLEFSLLKWVGLDLSTKSALLCPFWPDVWSLVRVSIGAYDLFYANCAAYHYYWHRVMVVGHGSKCIALWNLIHCSKLADGGRFEMSRFYEMARVSMLWTDYC